MRSKSLSLRLLPERFAICRLAPDAPLPQPPPAGLWSATRTADELSVVLPESARDPRWQAETGWRCFKLAGPIDFNLTGVLASLTAPLAAADLSLFAISTYDTDYLLVREESLAAASAALTAAGHRLG